MRCRLFDLTITYDKKQRLVLELPEGEFKDFDSLSNKDLSFELKPLKRHRTLDSNAYAWVLINKIAERVKIPPDYVYREAIRDVAGNYEVLPIRDNAVETFREAWQSKGVGWLVENLGKSKIDGYTNLRVFYGSSVYDTDQMSRLIDILVNEAKEYGIETMPPEELERLMKHECKQ